MEPPLKATRQRRRGRLWRFEASPYAISPVFYRYPAGLAVVLAGYLFFSRGFAYWHLPGTPIFISEILLIAGLCALIRVPEAVSEVVRRSRVLWTLAAFVALGVISLLHSFPTFGMAAVRDAAIFYYSGVALIVSTMLFVRPRSWDILVRGYEAAMPWFLMWAPLAVVLGRLWDWRRPYVPDSSVSIFSLKSGDFAVHVAMAVTYMWLLQECGRPWQSRRRTVLTGLAIVGLLVAASQNRGGMLASGVTLLVGFAALRRTDEHFSYFATAGALCMVLLSTALLLNVSIDLGGRSLSAQQLLSNITSATGHDSMSEDEALSDTVEWRLTFWSDVLHDVQDGAIGPFGLGFGSNLAVRYDVPSPQHIDSPLRNAHNSHLTILARMGVIGFALWIAFWVGLIVSMHRRVTTERGRRWAWWLTASLLGIHVNAVFDPTLEGPQVAVWLWTLVGVALAQMLSSQDRGSALSQREPYISFSSDISVSAAAGEEPST